jgi:alkaline phosphatase D
MAQEELHVVFHLGDYIYEGEIRERPPRVAPPEHVRPEPTTLAGYRLRYALYKQDPDLQAAHHAFPFVVTTDDHEVENNYADAIAQDPEVSPEAFLVRRAAAYQAYYEHMPLRRRSRPSGPDMLLYRRLRYGDLAEFNVLDFRQYSDDQPCGDGDKPPCPEVYDPERTVLGARQERWLYRGFARSRARWNVLAQQTIMAKLDRQAGPGEVLRLDKWHAFPHARDRLFGQMLARGLSNPVVLTGDVHENYVADLKLGFDDPDGPLVATEFVGTSVTSQGDGADVDEDGPVFLAENPWVKFYNAQRGYVRCEITPERWTTDFRVVPYVTRPGAPVSTRSSWEVRDGVPGAQRTA